MQRKYFLSTTSRNSYETSSKNKYKLHKILKTEPSVASFATDESKLVQTKEIKRILEARSLPKK